MLLFDVVYAHRASGAHHKIALDALRRLSDRNAQAWTKLFLSEADLYMKGAKAPDDVFKDSMNHVLHVRDGYWGGAIGKAEEWYARLVELLTAKAWPEAVYAAGVLSHYVADPFQPLHTAQSESEGAVHRAFEQSVSKSYKLLKARVEQQGWPAAPDTSQEGWIGAMIKAGAHAGEAHYEDCIDHYNLDKGVKSPPDGLDAHLHDVMAGALGRAVTAFAATLDRAFAHAAVAPPAVDVTVEGYLAALDIPVQWVLRKMEDAAERKVVEAMYGEYAATGKVVKTLPGDDRVVREAHATAVLKKPLPYLNAEPARKPGAMHGKPPPPTRVRPPVAAAPFVPPIAAPLTPIEESVEAIVAPAPAAPPEPPPEVLPEVLSVESTPLALAEPAPEPAATAEEPPAPDQQTAIAAEPAAAPEAPASTSRRTAQSPVVDAPAIGARFSERLNALGVATIGDLLGADPEGLAQGLGLSFVTPQTVRGWQAMAQLAIDVDGIGEQEAEILVSAGVPDKSALAACDAHALQGQLAAFLDTDAGRRITRGRAGPKPEKVEALIEAARRAS